MSAAALTLPADQIVAAVQQAAWPLVRISTFIAAAPVIGTHAVPRRVKTALALLLTLVLLPVLPPAPAVQALSVPGLMTAIAQVLVGLTLAISVRLVFMVLELAGQIIGMQMGLGFAAMVDPQNGAQVPVVGQFYVIFGTLAFLAGNGHLALLQVLADSFQRVPIAATGLDTQAMRMIVELPQWLFISALSVALPAVVALLIVNLALGVMTRAAPQLNIFAVGMPITILIGAAVMLLTLPALGEHYEALFAAGLALAAGGP
ncbi:MAG: flagellar biosynthetic protein FliR [Gammaproteobacteria bacterium]